MTTDQGENPSATAAWDLALRRISMREHSARELGSYLKQKKFDPEVCEEIVARFVEKGWIDDLRYARMLARSIVQKDQGPLQILLRLRAKGVEIKLSQAQELFHEISPETEGVRIKGVLNRRYSNYKDGDKQYRRAFNALLRRGFSPEAVQKCMKAFGDTRHDEEGSP